MPDICDCIRYVMCREAEPHDKCCSPCPKCGRKLKVTDKGSFVLHKPVEKPTGPVSFFSCGVSKNCLHGGEHQWDGPPLQEFDEEGNQISEASTCSKCGIDSLSFALWNGP